MSQILNWDQYFMSMAHLAAMRSKDPSTQVGACIINNNKRIVGVGYNGFPRGCEDDEFPWGREGNLSNTKYAYVVHAELNAILNSTGPLDNCVIFVSLFPCNECAKAIIQSRITEVVYEDDKYAEDARTMASKRMLESAGVNLRRVGKVDIDIKV